MNKTTVAYVKFLYHVACRTLLKSFAVLRNYLKEKQKWHIFETRRT